MNPNTQDNNTPERSRAVRIAALVAVILMGGLIVAAVVISFLNIENSGKYVIGLLTISFVLGVVIYLIGLFSRLSKSKKDVK
ncbi:MAG: hypothetical protein J5499_03660 [Lachnospiraceae bacterium]|nr:hypothetical protein [Lachnospiraceae bacterium]MBO4762499.1 hypothetical protein [Lachnospiraceae bacterium]MBR5368194.1 hypothetical protein [Lachnospiraceae bacterium]